MNVNSIPNGKAEIYRTYGDPTAKGGGLSEAWESSNIVGVPIPWASPFNKMRLSWDVTHAIYQIRIHKVAAPDLAAILKDIWRHAALEANGLTSTAPIEDQNRKTITVLRASGLDLFGGSFAYRIKRGNAQLSLHSFGCAIDINDPQNAMGTPGTMPVWVVNIFRSYGWVWGGDWKGSNSDPMHFQRASGY
jgi:hypothetical protein